MGGYKQTELKQQFAQAHAAAAALDVNDGQDSKEERNAYEPPNPSELPPITASVGETEEDQKRGEKARDAISILQQNDPSSASIYLDDGQENFGPTLDVVQQRQTEMEQERFMNDFEGFCDKQLASETLPRRERMKNAGNGRVMRLICVWV
jgi:hypothetical protein